MDLDDALSAPRPRKRKTRPSGGNSGRQRLWIKRRRDKPQDSPNAKCVAEAFSLSDGPLGSLTVGSACAGWCAESQALTLLGVPHRVEFVADNCKDVQRFLKGNLKYERLHSDVFSDGFAAETSVDILCAGPPCQPYSREGDQKGDEDERASVVEPIIDYCSKQRPLVILLENVPQWKTVGKKNFNRCWERLSQIKAEDGEPFYNLYCQNINSLNYGCPQNRIRLYVVALARFADLGFTWPEASPAPDLSSIVDDGSVFHASCSPEDVPPAMLTSETKITNLAHALVKIEDDHPFSKQYVVDVGAGRGNRLYKDHFPTLTASRCQRLDYWSPNMRRRFRLKELARGQGASANGLNMESVSKTAMGHIIGNAMSIGVVRALLQQALQAIGVL